VDETEEKMTHDAMTNDQGFYAGMEPTFRISVAEN
jgi:hypothetical protein